MKFEIGDRVRYIMYRARSTYFLDGTFHGKYATVLDSHGDMLALQFDDYIGGHSGNGMGRDGHCWNVAEYEIEHKSQMLIRKKILKFKMKST